MCGIFGYVGNKNPVALSLTGLKRMEYRGYDSAGIGGTCKGSIAVLKEVGKVSSLEKMVEEKKLSLETAIAHTRWATHGVPSVANAHPHTDQGQTLVLVHNGIIENHDALRKELKEEGVKFASETDSEVVAQLIGKLYKGDILKTMQEVVPLLRGAFAIALVHKDHPGKIFAVAHESPLAVGIGEGEAFIASDPQAFADHTRDVVFLTEKEIAVVSKEKLEIYNVHNHKISKNPSRLELHADDISKGSFAHFTLKEIHEQPQSFKNALLSRVVQEWGTAQFEELKIDRDQLSRVERILIVACGTSWHAALIASYMIEEMARIPVQVEISSEFRYKNPIVPHGTLALAISQSGETADTLAAVRELKAKSVPVIGICNVNGSTLAREADGVIFLRAGPEIGVCSTKAFSNQLAVLALFSLLLARQRHMGKLEGQEFLKALLELPGKLQHVLDLSPKIQELAKKYSRFENFFFLGRQYMFPTALEGALKLKEISYINANGYPAGEMKHGPIALISPDCPTVAFTANASTFEKMESNLMEVKARKGPIIAVIAEGTHVQAADDVIVLPSTTDSLSPVLSSVAGQLFAYYVALNRGAEIDQPRNLAKSVTVE